MPIYVRQYLGRAAIRNSDQRLVPAIMACNFSVCFLLFGVFLTISGIIFRSIAKSSDSYSPTIGGNGYSPSQTAVTVGTVILSVGSVLVFIGLCLLVFAWISFKRYETMRRNELQNSNSATNANFETSFTNNNITHYPPPTRNPISGSDKCLSIATTLYHRRRVRTAAQLFIARPKQSSDHRSVK